TSSTGRSERGLSRASVSDDVVVPAQADFPDGVDGVGAPDEGLLDFLTPAVGLAGREVGLHRVGVDELAGGVHVDDGQAALGLAGEVMRSLALVADHGAADG